MAAAGAPAGQVTGVTPWHINADEDPLFDNNDEIWTTGESSFERKSGALPLNARDANRSSEHDPVIVGPDLAKAEKGLGMCHARRQRHAGDGSAGPGVSSVLVPGAFREVTFNAPSDVPDTVPRLPRRRP